MLVGCARSVLRAEVESELGAGGDAPGTEGSSGRAGSPNGSAPTCLVRPEQTEGPYFLDEMLNRSDIRIDPVSGVQKPGVPLEVSLRVFDASEGACVPLSGALVDLWQCDAAGIYSDVAELGTSGQRFLRGHQLTGVTGDASFVTVYPGWYPGRTPHLHFKVRFVDRRGTSRAFTSQLYFEEGVNDAVLAGELYAARGPRSVSNATDAIFRAGGSELILPVAPKGSGYAGAFEIGLILA